MFIIPIIPIVIIITTILDDDYYYYILGLILLYAPRELHMESETEGCLYPCGGGI
jgi:hypothetical protein